MSFILRSPVKKITQIDTSIHCFLAHPLAVQLSHNKYKNTGAVSRNRNLRCQILRLTRLKTVLVQPLC